MGKHRKKLAPKPPYVSPSQLTIDGFETPFEQHLLANNRWVVLSKLIPWDELCNEYLKHVGVSGMGPKPINPRIVIGALIIKHKEDLDDREVVAQISENVYMQYFLGYSSFNPEPPFDSSLFVEIRNRLSLESLNAMNERIIAIRTQMESLSSEATSSETIPAPEPPIISETSAETGSPPVFENDVIHVEPEENENPEDTDSLVTPAKPSSKNNAHHPVDNTANIPSKNKGKVIFDATCCPQDIAYPTDLNLLSDARKKSEQLIDILYNPDLHSEKPRTYRKIARKEYLKTAMKKNKTNRELRRAVKKQLAYLNRNIGSIDKLLDAYPTIPLNRIDYKYMLVIRTLYDQQLTMFVNKTHTIEDRIVSIHQPHVRPIVRGKAQAKVEFGPKIHISVIDGFTFLDKVSWDAFNEGSDMMVYVENYFKRFGFYPREILADKIYCTRDNRRKLKEKGIKLVGKPLGRPSAVTVHVSPGERNPVEGKFGQAKTAYGLGRIRARLKETSESWIASIILVLNLVKLAGSVSYCLYCIFHRKISLVIRGLSILSFLGYFLKLLSTFQKIQVSGRLTYSATPN